MPAAPVTVYDNNMRRVALLENAFTVGYETPLNGLWTASFSLPANDPKNAECQPLRFVELYDGRERVELFRILPTTAKRSSDGKTVTYSCEHVLATLIDDVLFQYHTIGNLGVYTAEVLAYILQRQTVQRWQLGTVEFARQFEYNWENETLLAAIMSVPKPFDVGYQWTWDTTVYPWKLNLVAASSEVAAFIRYGINMQGVERVVDPSNVCNRLYALGYGEGVNQLTFADINGGKPYVEDTASQAQYGIISRVWVDRRFEYPETLLARAEALLDEMKQPRVSYTVQASEIHRLTGQDIYRFRTGTNVRVQDKDLGIDITARVVNVRKRDLYGAPGAVEIEIANRPQDIAGTIAELANRQRINEVYAQGATNLVSHDFADNADPTHPAILRLYIPEETARINKMQLSYQVEAFRAYERAIAAAPAITSGPSSTSTTAAGGQTTSGPSSTSTTVPSGGQHLTDTSSGGSWEISGSYGTPEVSQLTGYHDHGISAGTVLVDKDGGWHTWVPSGNHRHGLVPHTHSYATIDHVHGMDHTHQIAAHVHGMDHTHIIPSHTHEIEYGIFEGPTPTSIEVQVDGNLLTGLGTSVQDVDIIPYLSKDGSGKVNRGWHEIKITPNGLGRIVANLNSQIFVQSRGGGNF
ncbi:phage tail protein [Paenibacillus sp. JMULE4]|uniref:phage tail protein n=1 Tax=Paenibacillus sp. JMULE4 TaxID=2518342 RepID=UPI0020C60225|nr:phage tail protein [Paenibacillus sp. JMULE4]